MQHHALRARVIEQPRHGGTALAHAWSRHGGAALARAFRFQF